MGLDKVKVCALGLEEIKAWGRCGGGDGGVAE